MKGKSMQEAYFVNAKHGYIEVYKGEGFVFKEDKDSFTIIDITTEPPTYRTYDRDCIARTEKMARDLFEQQKKVEIQHLEEQIKWTKIRIPYLISVKEEKEARREREALERQRGEIEEENPYGHERYRGRENRRGGGER